MVVYEQTQYLTEAGTADGHVVVGDATNLAPGIEAILSSSDGGPFSVRIETVDYDTNTLRLSRNDLYVSLDAFAPTNGAKLDVARQKAPSNYVPAGGGGGSPPGGTNGQIQFNSDGVFGGTPAMVWNINSNTLEVLRNLSIQNTDPLALGTTISIMSSNGDYGLDFGFANDGIRITPWSNGAYMNIDIDADNISFVAEPSLSGTLLIQSSGRPLQLAGSSIDLQGQVNLDNRLRAISPDENHYLFLNAWQDGASPNLLVGQFFNSLDRTVALLANTGSVELLSQNAPLVYTSGMEDVAGAAHTFNTSISLSAAKLVSFQHLNVEKLFVDRDGTVGWGQYMRIGVPEADFPLRVTSTDSNPYFEVFGPISSPGPTAVDGSILMVASQNLAYEKIAAEGQAYLTIRSEIDSASLNLQANAYGNLTIAVTAEDYAIFSGAGLLGYRFDDFPILSRNGDATISVGSADGQTVSIIGTPFNGGTFDITAVAGTLNLSANEITSNADFTLAANKGVVLRSPNGTKYRLKVADDGSLSTEVVP